MSNELMSNELKQWFFRDSLNTILSLRYDGYREMYIVSISNNIIGSEERSRNCHYNEALAEYNAQLKIRKELMVNAKHENDCDCTEGCYGCHLLYESLHCQCSDESEKENCINPDCPIARQNAITQGVSEDDFNGCSNIY
jgi:hypothetical protein